MPPTQIQKIGPYQIQAEIRRDPFSITYQAVDTNKKLAVTLRVLEPELASDPLVVRRFISIGQEIARLHHDNIAQVYETGEYDGYYYTTGELVNGNTLLGLLIQRSKLLSATEVTSIVQQIATALDYAHEQGVLHLDLNFRHILITEDKRALLTDFGLDELRRDVYNTNSATEKVQPTDISVFTAPEQARGDFDLDYRADIYSLGVLVYAMLVGKLPFEASDNAELRREILEQAPPPPNLINPRLSERVANILNKALAKEPAQRYDSAGEFAKVLTQSLLWATDDQGLAELASEDEDDLPDKPPLLSRGCLISTLSAALVLLAALTFALFYARPVVMDQLAALGFGSNSAASITPTAAIATPMQPVLVATAQPTAAPAIAQSNMSTTPTNTVEATPLIATENEVNGAITATQASTGLVENSPVASMELSATAQTAEEQATATTLPATLVATSTETPVVPTNTDTAVPTAAAKPTDTATPAAIATAAVSLVLTPTLETTVAIQSANVQTVETPANMTATLTVTPTVSGIMTPTNPTPPATATITPTSTTLPTATNPPAPTATMTSSATPLPPATATATMVPTNTPAPTATPVPTNTAVPTPTVAPTATVTPTATAMPTATVTPMPTATLAPEPTLIPTTIILPTATAVPTATVTPMPTATLAPEPTLIATAIILPTDTLAPTATATRQATATNTATSVPTATLPPTANSTPVPTATIQPTDTALPTATAIQTATATVTNSPEPTSTSTATMAPTATATNTAEPTVTFTATPVATPTSLPTATATKAPIPPSFDQTNLRRPLADGTAPMRGTGQPGSTVQVLVDNVVAGTTVVRANGAWALAVALGDPGSYRISVQAVNSKGVIIQSNTRPITVIVPTPTPIPTPTVTIGAVELVGPGDGTAGTGVVDFQWSANFKPDAGLAFELVFWKEGQNPLASGFGLAAPTTSTKATVNLSALDDKLGDLLEPGNYKWGILLVRVSPYQRVQFMGQARTFRFDRGSNNSGGGSGSSSGGGQNSGE